MKPCLVRIMASVLMGWMLNLDLAVPLMPLFQVIINKAATSTIKKVFFPPGVYQVNGDIAIADSVELYGT